MVYTFDTFLDNCLGYIGRTKTTATIAEIDEAIRIYSTIASNSIDTDAVKRALLSHYNVTTQAFRVLEKDEARTPWLESFKPKCAWRFWNDYKRYLREICQYNESVVKQLDLLTDHILDNTFDPTQNEGVSKYGMVVGQVQSGKTANYSGLICKAADAGFNFIIVLSGILENLRCQTQQRIDQGFLGRNTETEEIEGVGVLCSSHPVAHSLTTQANRADFSASRANSLGIGFNTSEPIILVMKKNASVLSRLVKWLNAQKKNLGTETINTKSLLFIDDEADNASLNTSDKNNPSKINENIRKILGLFGKKAYVGYTATPFANVFISQEPVTRKDIGVDVFPRDFIINIPAPSNYIGPEKIFGIHSEPSADEYLLPIVTTINDTDGFLPTKHKKDCSTISYNTIPNSLKAAIKSFIVSTAIRKARNVGNKHSTMLIHMTRYKSLQDELTRAVKTQFKYYKQEILANDATVMEELRSIYELDSSDYKSFVTITTEIKNSVYKDIDQHMSVLSWDDVRIMLADVVSRMEVVEINGNSKDSLRYSKHPEGYYVIAVGGDCLSRGLTLEGLSVSYFMRASKMYDTLMQMGRWFGYRTGYVDLCRLYTSAELNSWYRHISNAIVELREEFDLLAAQKKAPEDFALKVRTHSGCLQITSAAKLRGLEEIKISWGGRLVETYQLPMQETLKHGNVVATDNLISNLTNVPESGNGYYLWRGISPDAVLSFLDNFKVASDLKSVNLERIKAYITNVVDCGELSRWNIALKTKANSQSHYTFTSCLTVGCFDRNRATDTITIGRDDTYFIRNNRILGGAEDEYIDLDVNTLGAALNYTQRQKKDWKHSYPSPTYVRQMYRNIQEPLLIIYPLNPASANILNPDGSIKEGTKSFSVNEEPFFGFAISFPRTESGIAVGYMVNRTEYIQETDDFEESNNN